MEGNLNAEASDAVVLVLEHPVDGDWNEEASSSDAEDLLVLVLGHRPEEESVCYRQGLDHEEELGQEDPFHRHQAISRLS